MDRTATNEMIQGMRACADIPCENYEERDACMDSLYRTCASGLTPAVDAFCSRVDECDPDSLYEECVQMYNQFIGCYSATVQSAMLTCSSRGNCVTFQDAFEQCMTTQLGIVDCNPGDD
jgi:hypothetical protein